MLKRYYCSPTGLVIPAIFLVLSLFIGAFFAWEEWLGLEHNTNEWLCCAVVISISLLSAFFTTRVLGRYVTLHPDHIVCCGLFSKKIAMQYDKCYVGIDYGNHRNRQTWWIYLSYDPYPPFKKDAYYNRINAQYCKDGFVRIMYNKDVYKALMNMLPKKQRTMLGASYSLHLAHYDS